MPPLNISMDPTRAILLAGLGFHKALWEVMKRRPAGRPAAVKEPLPLLVRFTKLVKIATLLGVVVQVIAPAVLPIPDPTGLVRVAGLGTYLVGLAVAVIGRLQLGDNWLDIETAGVKTGQSTVSSGIYAYVRHPIYAGDLLLLLGLELALGSWLFLAVFPLALAVMRQAIQEERKLLESLPGYDSYCRRTRRFIPFVM